MKNKIFTAITAIALLTFTLFSQSTFAGGETKFGPVAGINLANVGGDNTSDNAMKLGFHFGFVVDLGITDNFIIEPGIFYSIKGTQSSANSDAKINLNYLDIPILAKYQLESGLNFFLGPYVGILMSATTEPGGGDIKEFLNTTDFGLKVGIGYQMGSGLGFNAHYGLGLANLNKSVSGGGTTPSNQNAVIGISVSYMLGGK